MVRNKIFFFFSLLLLASVLTACGTTALAQTEEPRLRTLTVTGSGQAFLTPDIAYIAIGVHTEGKDASEAVASNNTQSQKVADALKTFKIDPKDIQTRNFSIYPQQEFQDGKVIGTTYIVDNAVYVTLRDLTAMGDLLDAVVKAGANSINSIQFDVADKSEALSEARSSAVADASAQAGQLAEAAGVTLGEVQSINTFSGAGPQPVFDARAEAVGGAGVPISPGQMILTVEVNLVYEIR